MLVKPRGYLFHIRTAVFLKGFPTAVFPGDRLPEEMVILQSLEVGIGENSPWVDLKREHYPAREPTVCL